ERIADQNEIEWPLKDLDEGRAFDIRDMKLQPWVGAARLLDHCRTEIHANAETGLQGRQGIAGSTAELEHAAAGRNQKAQIGNILGMVKRRPGSPVLPSRGMLFGVLENLLLTQEHEISSFWTASHAAASRALRRAV